MSFHSPFSISNLTIFTSLDLIPSCSHSNQPRGFPLQIRLKPTALVCRIVYRTEPQHFSPQLLPQLSLPPLSDSMYSIKVSKIFFLFLFLFFLFIDFASPILTTAGSCYYYRIVLHPKHFSSDVTFIKELSFIKLPKLSPTPHCHFVLAPAFILQGCITK